VGWVLVLLTGVLEGPAYAGGIALRQRHAPPEVRAQLVTTITSSGFVIGAAGSVVGGIVGRIEPEVILFAAVNLLAAGVSVLSDSRSSA
jgi:hypothetical protein